MAVNTIIAAMTLLRTTSAKAGITIDQASMVITDWEEQRKTEQLTTAEKREARSVFAPQIAEIFGEDPDLDLDPAEIAQRLGMPNKQGTRSFVRHQLKQLRLTYRQQDTKIAAD